MKKLFLFAFITISSLSGYAQSGNAKSLSFSAGIELGSFNPIFKGIYGVGGTVQADYGIANNLALTLNTGYISFTGTGSGGFIPVLVGGKYTTHKKIYASLQTGLVFNTPASSAKKSEFAIVPGLGYNITNNLDVLVKYLGIVDNGISNNICLRLGYTFK
jgi:hypothetical protein